MAIITAHTLFSDSIDIALSTGELRTKAQILQEFQKEYSTFSFDNHTAFELETKLAASKLESDMGFLLAVYKKILVETLLQNKEEVEQVILDLEANIILLDANIARRKAQLSDIEKFRAFVSDEENLAKKRNIDFGMLLSYAKTTAGYLSYVLTVDPAQLVNTATTSPLTRFKDSKDRLKAALIAYGYNSPTGSTVLDTLKALVATMDSTLEVLPEPQIVPDVVLTQNTYEVVSIPDTIGQLETILTQKEIAALALPTEIVNKYFQTFGIENSKRAETVLMMEGFQQKIKKTLVEAILSAREEIRKESIGAAAKLRGYENEIRKKRNLVELKKTQLAEASAKITAGARDIVARIAAVQNFYDNLLRQGTEIMGSYANSVVSSVPAQATDVIAEFKEFLDMQTKEIDVRI